MKSFDIEQYLFDNLERPKHSRGRHGMEVTANCPCCSKRKFYANTESGKFVCFACRFQGRSIIPLVAELEELTWSEAASFVFRASVTLRRRETLLSLKERVAALRPKEDDGPAIETVDYGFPEHFIPVWSEKTGWNFPLYLKKERGITGKTAKAWGMGWVSKSPREPEAQNFRNRLIIPIDCPNGKSFTARDMVGTSSMKYLNPDGADHSRLLIGWNMARLTGDLVICEGPLDAVMLWQHGISAVALGGKVLHEAQMNMLTSFLPSSTAIVVMLDPEELTAPHEVAGRLSAYFDQIYLAKLPEGTDPGSSTKQEATNAVENAKRWRGSRDIKVRLASMRAKAAMSKRWRIGLDSSS